MANEDARADLHDELMRISEEAMSAQWYDDLEFIIWDRIGRGASRLGSITLTKSLLEELLHLSRRAGGWFRYSDEAEHKTGSGLVFVADDKWERMYSEWLSRVPAEARPRDR